MDGGYGSNAPYSVMVTGLLVNNYTACLSHDPTLVKTATIENCEIKLPFPEIHDTSNNGTKARYFKGIYIKDDTKKYQDYSVFFPKEFAPDYEYYSPWGFPSNRNMGDYSFSTCIGDTTCLWTFWNNISYDSNYSPSDVHNMYNKYSRLIYLPLNK